MAITHLYNDNFIPVIQSSEKLVLVDFWATWCGPCRMIAPIVEEIAGEYEEAIEVFKVDVDDADAIASEYGIMSIPTLMIMKNGKELERIIGYRPKEEIIKVLQKYM